MTRLFVIALLSIGCGQNSGGQTPPSPASPASPPSPPPAAPAPAPAPAPAAPRPAAAGADIRRPCSMVTAAEVSGIVGFAVTVQDEQFRCKFVDSKHGWLSLELMEASSRSAHDICEYARDKRTVVAGVGDSASYLGATACVKLGDVAIVVDGSNLADHSAALGHSGADSPYILVAKLVASRVP